MNTTDYYRKLGQKVIYQIYPKSFYDSNGDGIGDLRGIIQKIPYIEKLNVDMIWFNPFFVSPQNDNGYDIADYYKIDPRFGTMADFKELEQRLKEIHVDVMLDMVLNHCSTSHPWFQKALAGDPKYRAYFYIRPSKKDGSVPTNWQSKFGGSAWKKFGNSSDYYLHLYDPTQADLDWHNPDVRKEAAQIVNFWRNKGVKGFRFDVINVTGKDTNLRNSTDPQQEKKLYTDTPVVHTYLKELNQNSFGRDSSIITVGEMSSTTVNNSIAYTQPQNHELSMVFTFHHLKVDYKNGNKWKTIPFDFAALKKLLFEWQTELDRHGGWNALFWNNHDQPRALNRFGNVHEYREKSAEMLALVLHLLRGTPYIYQGEELGMPNPSYSEISSYNDVETKNAYNALLKKGYSEQEAFKAVSLKSRDNSRTPMQWNATKYAGFSTTKPWLMPTNQAKINVERELAHGEIFEFYQKLIQLRKTEELIAIGHFEALFAEHPQVFAYRRFLNEQQIIVLANFYEKETSIEIPKKLQGQVSLLLGNYPFKYNEQLPKKLKLRPYEALAFKPLS
ncbi:alpha,alpha-phosphotrehalase [Liquorilactobacillus oeni]|nr:alpha,alpha-phosphotrehalase [Liquorilactobacillus oeni]